MFGIAEALGLTPDIRDIHPRPFYAAVAPFGPLDPLETETRPGSPIAPPWPDMALACGRRTLPYLRRIKRASKGHVFTVYLNAPANGPRAADLVVAPVHDGLFGPNRLHAGHAGQPHLSRFARAPARKTPTRASKPCRRRARRCSSAETTGIFG